MTGNCAVFLLWSACNDGGLPIGSIAELLTVVITTLALIAAAYAGYQAKIAASSARKQAEAAATALKHSAAAAESAAAQAAAATKAFEEDAKVREEAQARLVFSELGEPSYVVKGNRYTYDVFESRHRTVWDDAMLSPWQERDQTSQPVRNRITTANGVRMPVFVTNLSTEIISPVRLYFVDPSTGRRTTPGSFDEILRPKHEKLTYGVVIALPDGVNIMREPPAKHFASWVPVLEFRDSSGVWWRRMSSEPVVKLDDKGQPVQR